MKLSSSRALLGAWTVAFLLSECAAYGQTLEVVPVEVLKRNRDQYFQAMEDWQKGDPNLEKELHGPDRERILQRINEQDQRTKKAIDARRTFFHSLRGYLQEQTKRVQSSSTIVAPEDANQIRDSIEGVNRERHELDERIAKTREPEIRQKLRMQQLALESIEKSLNDQKYYMEQMSRADVGIAESRTKLLGNIKKVSDMLAQMETGADEEQTQFDRIFASMRQTAATPLATVTPGAGRGIPPPPNRFPDTSKTQEKIAVAAPDPIGSPGNGGGARSGASASAESKPSMTGTYVYVPATLDSTKPGSLRLEVKETNGRVEGSLTATRIPKALGLGPSIQFPFSGLTGKGKKFGWTAAGQSGDLEILMEYGKIELVWRNSRNVQLFDDLLDRISAN